MNIHITATVKRPVSLPITPMEGEARVLDTALAAQLGFTRPSDIRDLIKRHMDELEAFGIIPQSTEKSGQRGRPGTAYYLNRQQALLVCILSKTEKAKEVRAEAV